MGISAYDQGRIMPGGGRAIPGGGVTFKYPPEKKESMPKGSSGSEIPGFEIFSENYLRYSFLGVAGMATVEPLVTPDSVNSFVDDFAKIYYPEVDTVSVHETLDELAEHDFLHFEGIDLKKVGYTVTELGHSAVAGLITYTLSRIFYENTKTWFSAVIRAEQAHDVIMNEADKEIRRSL